MYFSAFTFPSTNAKVPIPLQVIHPQSITPNFVLGGGAVQAGCHSSRIFLQMYSARRAQWHCRFHTTWLMVSELTGLKSCWLFFLEYHAREGVPDTHGELKHRLVQVWAKLDHRHITAAIGQRRRLRLNPCSFVCESLGGIFWPTFVLNLVRLIFNTYTLYIDGYFWSLLVASVYIGLNLYACLIFSFILCDDLFDKYVVKTGFNCSFKACVREHCRYMLRTFYVRV